jgi:hypothetical protein
VGAPLAQELQGKGLSKNNFTLFQGMKISA